MQTKLFSISITETGSEAEFDFLIAAESVQKALEKMFANIPDIDTMYTDGVSDIEIHPMGEVYI